MMHLELYDARNYRRSRPGPWQSPPPLQYASRRQASDKEV